MAGGFWAGFGDELTGRIKEREQFIRDETAKRQDYLLRVGVPARMRMNQQMQEDVTTIRQAQELGFSERTAVALWQAGQLDSAMQTAASGEAPADYTETVVTWATDQAGDNLTAQEAVARAYGAASSVNASTPEGRRRGFFEAMFALNPQGAVEDNMASFNVAGMTQNDLLAAAGFSGPQMTPVEGARYNPTAGYAMSETDQPRFNRLFQTVVMPYYQDGFLSQTDQYGNVAINLSTARGQEVSRLQTEATDAYNRLRRFGLDGQSKGLDHGQAMQYITAAIQSSVVDGAGVTDVASNLLNSLGVPGNETEAALGVATPTGGMGVETPEVTVTTLPDSVESVISNAEKAITEAETAVAEAGNRTERERAEQNVQAIQEEIDFLKNLPEEQKAIAEELLKSNNPEAKLDEIIAAYGEQLKQQGVPQYEIPNRQMEYRNELEDIVGVIKERQTGVTTSSSNSTRSTGTNTSGFDASVVIR